MIDDMTIAYYSSNYEDPMAYLRVVGFAEANGIKLIPAVQDGKLRLECIRDAEIVFLQRDFTRSITDIENLFSFARQLGKPVVMDLDDLIFDLPEDHPDRINHHYVDSLIPMLLSVMQSDEVIVSTHAMAEAIGGLNSHVKVIPNYLNDTLWYFNEPLAPPVDQPEITIGYMGGRSHLPDLQMVLPALIEILQKYPGRIHYHFWGLEPPKDIAEVSRVDFPPYNYPEFSRYFNQQTADIMIAPLRENLFNSCKSSIKYLEYGAIGCPGVYSKIRPYESVIDDGVDGILASTTKDWVEAITRLIEDPALRHAMAQKAQQKIKQQWLLSKNSGVFADFLNELNSSNDLLPSASASVQQLLGSIGRQIDDALQNRGPQIQKLNDKIVEKDQKIISFQNEINDYLNSTSWKITKPLRQLSNLFIKKG